MPMPAHMPRNRIGLHPLTPAPVTAPPTQFFVLDGKVSEFQGSFQSGADLEPYMLLFNHQARVRGRGVFVLQVPRCPATITLPTEGP